MDGSFKRTSINPNYKNYHSKIVQIVEDDKDVKSSIVKWINDSQIAKKNPILTTVIITIKQQYDAMLQVVPDDKEIKRRYNRILEIRNIVTELVDIKKESFLLFDKGQDKESMTDEDKQCLSIAQKHFLKQKTQLYYKITKSNVALEDAELSSLLFIDDEHLLSEKKVISDEEQATLADKTYNDLIKYSFTHNMDQSRIFSIILQKLNDTPTMSFYYIRLLKNMNFSKNSLEVLLTEIDRNIHNSKDLSFLSTGAAFAFIAHHGLIDFKELFYLLSPQTSTEMIELNKKVENNYVKRIKTASRVKMDYSSLNYNMDVVEENNSTSKQTSAPTFVTASEVIEFQNKADDKVAGEVDDWNRLCMTHRKLGYVWSLFRIHRYDLALPLLECLPNQLVINMMPNFGIIIGDIITEKLKKDIPVDKNYKSKLTEIMEHQGDSDTLFVIINDLKSLIFLAGPYLGKHCSVCKKLIDILIVYMHAKNDVANIEKKYYYLIKSLVTRILIPGIAFTLSPEEYSCKLHKLLKLFPIEERYNMYDSWIKDVGIEYRSIGLAQMRVFALMKFYSNRISKDNAKESFKELAPFIEDHPYEALRCMIGMIQFNDVMIPILVETLRVMTDLSLDVLGFTIYKYLNENFNSWISNDDLVSIKNVSKFVGRIVAEHGIDVSCILKFVDDKLAEVNAYVLYLLKEILYSFNYKISQSSLTNEQVVAMAGGEFLQKTFDISDITKAKVDWSELCSALKDNGTFYSIYKHLSITKISLKKLSMESEDMEVKQNNLALMDICQDVINQFTHIINDELIPNSSSLEKIPPIDILLKDGEVTNIELSWSLKRLAFWESVKRSFDKKMKNCAFSSSDSVESKKQEICKEAITSEIEKIEKCIVEPLSYLYKSIPLRIYCIFWLCNVDTLIFPSTKYKEKINELQNIKIFEDRFEEDYDRKKKKEDDMKRKNMITDLEKEQKDLKPKRRRVRKVISSLLLEAVNGSDGSRDENGCLSTTFCEEFVKCCIMPRHQLSRYEAFYCSTFVRTLHDLCSVKISTKKILHEIFQVLPKDIAKYSSDECSDCGLLLLKSFEISDDVYSEIHKIETDSKKVDISENTTSNGNEKEKKSLSKNGLLFDYNNPLITDEIFAFIYNEQDVLCDRILKLLSGEEMQTHVNALTVVSEMIDVFPKYKDHCKKLLEIVEVKSQDPELKKTKALPVWLTMLRKLKDKKNLSDGIKKAKSEKDKKKTSKSKEEKNSRKSEKENDNKEKSSKDSTLLKSPAVENNITENSSKSSKRDSSRHRDQSKDSVNDKENGLNKTSKEETKISKFKSENEDKPKNSDVTKPSEQSISRSKSSDKNCIINGDKKIGDVSTDSQKQSKQNEDVKESPSENSKNKYPKSTKDNDKKESSQSSEKNSLKRSKKDSKSSSDKERSSKTKKSKESSDRKRKSEKISDKKSKKKTESSQILITNGAEAITPDSPEKESFAFNDNYSRSKSYSKKQPLKKASSPDFREKNDSFDENSKDFEIKSGEEKNDNKDKVIEPKRRKIEDKKVLQDVKEKIIEEKIESPTKNESNDVKKKDKVQQSENPYENLGAVSISPDIPEEDGFSKDNEEKNKSINNKEDDKNKDTNSHNRYHNKDQERKFIDQDRKFGDKERQFGEQDRKFGSHRARITGPILDSDKNNYDSSQKRRVPSYRHNEDCPSTTKKPRHDRDHSSSIMISERESFILPQRPAYCKYLDKYSKIAVSTYQLDGNSDRSGSINLFDKTLNHEKTIDLPEGVFRFDINKFNDKCLLASLTNGSLGYINIENYDVNYSSQISKGMLLNQCQSDKGSKKINIVTDNLGSVFILDHEEGDRVMENNQVHFLRYTKEPCEVWSCGFLNLNDGNIFGTGGDDGILKIWDIRQGLSRVTSEFTSNDNNGITFISPSLYKEHEYIVGSYDAELRIFDSRKTNESLASLKLNGGIWYVEEHIEDNLQTFYCSCMYGGWSMVNRCEDEKLLLEYSNDYDGDKLLYGVSRIDEDYVVNCTFNDYIVRIESTYLMFKE
uniref:THO complex subunit 2 n=1 Tax=Parastrongyloides trichosuri TaxID=131310 RepID=A0A0N4Z240_PARTI